MPWPLYDCAVASVSCCCSDSILQVIRAASAHLDGLRATDHRHWTAEHASQAQGRPTRHRETPCMSSDRLRSRAPGETSHVHLASASPWAGYPGSQTCSPRRAPSRSPHPHDNGMSGREWQRSHIRLYLGESDKALCRPTDGLKPAPAPVRLRPLGAESPWSGAEWTKRRCRSESRWTCPLFSRVRK